MELAIKDAIFYHAHCNLMAGLVEAGDLIYLGKRPGIKGMNAALREMGETRSLVDVLTGKDLPKNQSTNDAIGALIGNKPATNALARISLTGVLSGLQKASDSVLETDKKWQEAQSNFGGLLDPITVHSVNGVKDAVNKAIKSAKDRIPAIAATLETIKATLKGNSSDDVTAKANTDTQGQIAEMFLISHDLTRGANSFKDAVEKALSNVKKGAAAKLTKSAESISQSVKKALAEAITAGKIAIDVTRTKLVRADALKTVSLRTIKAITLERDAKDALKAAIKAAKGLDKAVGDAAIAKIKKVADAATQTSTKIKGVMTDSKKSIVASLSSYANGLDTTTGSGKAALNRLAKVVLKTVPADLKDAKAALLKILTPKLSTTEIVALAQAIVAPPAPAPAPPPVNPP